MENILLFWMFDESINPLHRINALTHQYLVDSSISLDKFITNVWDVWFVV